MIGSDVVDMKDLVRFSKILLFGSKPCWEDVLKFILI
jgi:hypothetical protein